MKKCFFCGKKKEAVAYHENLLVKAPVCEGRNEIIVAFDNADSYEENGIRRKQCISQS